MQLPEEYIIACDEVAINNNFPNLTNEFTYSSLKNGDYNCIAWIEKNEEDWIQFYDEFGRLIKNPERYIHHFSQLGYAPTNNGNLETGKQKIAIYIASSSNRFKHVARQLEDGRWTSKLGEWEDIEHNTAENLLGGSYGDILKFMEKMTI
jgi:hypothetical protein